MYIVKDNQAYKVTSCSDNFVVATNGHYSTTFSNSEDMDVIIEPHEAVPDVFIHKNVFDGKSELDDRRYQGSCKRGIRS